MNKDQTTKDTGRGCAIFAGAFLFICFVLAMCNGGKENAPKEQALIPQAEQTTPKKPAERPRDTMITIHPDEVCIESNYNEIGLENKLKGDVQIKGRAGIIERLSPDKIAVFIYTDNPNVFVTCLFGNNDKEMIGALQRGENVAVVGNYRGITDGHPLFDNCFLW